MTAPCQAPESYSCRVRWTTSASLRKLRLRELAWHGQAPARDTNSRAGTQTSAPLPVPLLLPECQTGAGELFICQEGAGAGGRPLRFSRGAQLCHHSFPPKGALYGFWSFSERSWKGTFYGLKIMSMVDSFFFFLTNQLNPLRFLSA